MCVCVCVCVCVCACVCALKVMSPRRLVFSGTARQVKRRLCRQTSTLVQGIHWEFQEYGTWVAYSKAAAKVLEAATSRGEVSNVLHYSPLNESGPICFSQCHFILVQDRDVNDVYIGQKKLT